MSERLNPDQFTVPADCSKISKDLNRELLRSQPQDIYQFYENYFQRCLEDQRSIVVKLGVICRWTLHVARADDSIGFCQRKKGHEDKKKIGQTKALAVAQQCYHGRAKRSSRRHG